MRPHPHSTETADLVGDRFGHQPATDLVIASATIRWPARRKFRIGAASLEIGEERDSTSLVQSLLHWF
jgi:hypothetical protein